MKRFAFLLNFLLLVWLCGCSSSQAVETLNNWSFQYNEGTNDYSVFFELRDKSGNSISADVDVDIRIVNDSAEEVFKGTHSVSQDDFGYYTSQAQGEQYLANIRIPMSEITPGTDSSGKVYLTVYKADIVAFDEVNCDASYCLPIKDIQLESGPFPIELSVKGFDGSIASKIQIDDVTYVYEKGYTPTLTVTISGTKTYSNNNSIFSSGYDVISYKLYDSENYMVYDNALYTADKSKLVCYPAKYAIGEVVNNNSTARIVNADELENKHVVRVTAGLSLPEEGEGKMNKGTPKEGEASFVTTVSSGGTITIDEVYKK